MPKRWNELTPAQRTERMRRTLRQLVEFVYHENPADKQVFRRMVRGLTSPGDRKPELRKRGFGTPPAEEDLEN